MLQHRNDYPSEEAAIMTVSKRLWDERRNAAELAAQ